MMTEPTPTQRSGTPRPALEIPFRGDVRQLVLDRGCFDRDENERIYRKWFHEAPRYLFRAVDRKYNLTGVRLADIGCSYGMNLMHCASGSYGVEVDEREVAFAQGLGLPVFRRDAMRDDLSDLAPVEAIWCAAVLEHVDAPHVFLRKLYRMLVPGGLLVIFVPTIPVLPILSAIPRFGGYFNGHIAMDHVNAFTPDTLAFTCQRAGFHTVEVSPFYPGPLAVLNQVPIASRLIDGCVYVGRAIAGWEYPPKASRRVGRE